ncbi:helix-turn-helix transcriptional regulator [Myxococcota bacterium]|nr:helix-turn-helix transcriptional regulator [Myxococcota bacterium]MBU1382675.1 helix-turn-helix transcriptional regulator [Myxococcota bacterium]MBU1497973.1 helix-turn-helix transcriptional regulator [Myxococcota bacterium]
MDKIKKDENVLDWFEKEIQNDPELQDFENEFGALVEFIEEYEFLREQNKLTQKDIAEKTNTKQAAISRFEKMRSKPTYQFLNRLSRAVGGKLLLTPAGEFTVTLPADLRELAKTKAEKEGTTVAKLLISTLRTELSKDVLAQSPENKGKIILMSKHSSVIESEVGENIADLIGPNQKSHVHTNFTSENLKMGVSGYGR